jgi:UDP-N-acetylglucosamine 2-epimerase
MITVLSVIGTRPEAIKMAPVLRELARHGGRVRPLVCSTGQHREQLDQVLDLFGIRPDFELAVMRPDQTLPGLTAELFRGLAPVLQEARPDWVLAQGDTTTVFVAAVSACYQGARFGHVEAGLRTGDRRRPFPEEINRRLAGVVADLHFAPTEAARAALLREGVAEAAVVVTGNPVVDAVREVVARPYDWASGPLAGLPAGGRLVTVTAHRRESFGAPLRDLCRAVRELAGRFAPEGVHFVYPVHLNPHVRAPVREVLSGVPNVRLLEPLDYASMVQLLSRSELILTDSGGIQEEAPSLGVPVLVLRETTERPEGLASGLVRLVGTRREAIVAEAAARLAAGASRSRPAANPYGDGRAAGRIVAALLAAPATPPARAPDDRGPLPPVARSVGRPRRI